MFKLHIKLNANAEQHSPAYDMMEDFMLSGICSRVDSNVTEVVER